MSIMIAMPIFIIVAALVVFFIITTLGKGQSGIKLMLLGIQITLVGGIIAFDPNSNLEGFEYLIVLLGFVFSMFGFSKRE
jgi:hypothetical protein